MSIHRTNCAYNYVTTDEIYEVEDILNFFGHIDNRWFLIKWRGYDNPEWEREHLLQRDGCGDVIKDFWAKSGLLPCKKFYKDGQNTHRCAVCVRAFKRNQDLKAHRTRTGHHDDKPLKITRTAYNDAIEKKYQDNQNLLSKVKWIKEDGEDKIVENV